METFSYTNVILLLSATLTLFGDLLIAIVVLNVHGHIAKEKKIDKDVVHALNHEKKYVIFGILMVLTGYALEVISRLAL